MKQVCLRRGTDPWWASATLTLFLAAALGTSAPSPSAAQPPTDTGLLKPIGLAIRQDGRQVVVANRESGKLTILSTDSGMVVAEVSPSSNAERPRWSAMEWDGHSGPLLALDDRGHALYVYAVEGDQLRLTARHPVSSYPVSVRWNGATRRAHVACLWSRRVEVIELENPSQPRTLAVVDLAFAPREQLLVPGGRHWVVADAFGGTLAVLDQVDGRQLGVRVVPGHNLRGLAWDQARETVLMVHPILHPDEETTPDGVHWGAVMSNVLRSVPLTQLTGESRWEEARYYLGQPDRATGDPSDLILTPQGRRVISYAGLAELGISDAGANVFDHIAVGTRPTEMQLSPDGESVWVVNSLADSVSHVTLSDPPQVRTIALGEKGDETSLQRGERLFYDARLTADGWFSCHSCHTDGHSNGGLSDTLGDAGFGAPKRVLSLLGVGETPPWAWNGQVERLDQQVRKSLESTMQSKPTDQQVADLTRYLRTLPPPPSVLTARFGAALANRQPKLAAAAQRGREVFETRGCSACHTPDAYTSDGAYQVGLVDEQGNREFNPPSLRAVSQRDRLFHDNRATGLSEVLGKFRHGLREPLTPREAEDLLAFLNSL